MRVGIRGGMKMVQYSTETVFVLPCRAEEDLSRRVRVEGSVWVVIITMEQNVGDENSPIGKA